MQLSISFNSLFSEQILSGAMKVPEECMKLRETALCLGSTIFYLILRNKKCLLVRKLNGSKFSLWASFHSCFISSAHHHFRRTLQFSELIEMVRTIPLSKSQLWIKFINSTFSIFHFPKLLHLFQLVR